MPAKIDPDIVRMAAETVRAEVLRPPTIKLDPALLAKIRERVPVFQGMAQDQLLHTLALAEQYPVKDRETVFRQGDLGDSFYVVLSGEFAVERRSASRSVELARLGAGSCFGEMALVGKHTRSATLRAVGGDAVALRFYAEHVDASPETSALIYRNIARILSERLNTSSEMLADLVQSGRKPSRP
jgi:CRP/FNR family cyclic AMP-dependent transcriptional regulator